MRRCFQAFHSRRLFKNDLAMSNCFIFWHFHPTFATKKPYCKVNIGIYPSQISFQISSLGWSTHLPGFARVLIAKSRQLCEQPKLGTLKNQLSKCEKLVKHYPNTHTMFLLLLWSVLVFVPVSPEKCQDSGVPIRFVSHFKLTNFCLEMF